MTAHVCLGLGRAQLIGEERDRAAEERTDIGRQMTADQRAETECLDREWKPMGER